MKDQDPRKSAIRALNFVVPMAVAIPFIPIIVLVTSDPPSGHGTPFLSWLALGIALVTVPMSFVIRRVAATRLLPGEDPEAVRANPGARLSSAVLSAVAIAESGLLVGLVAYFQDGILWVAEAAMLLSLIGIGLHWPTRDRWAQWLSDTQRAAVPDSIIS